VEKLSSQDYYRPASQKQSFVESTAWHFTSHPERLAHLVLYLGLQEVFMPVLVTIAVALAAVLAAIVIGRAVWLWWKYRGARVITCPENQRPAGISVDAGHVAAHAFSQTPQLRLSACSRWPERAGCGQQCLSQVEAAPEDCLVRNILVQWYAGKRCASCGQPFGEISLAGAKPAVLRADKVSVEWSQIPADKLEETLAASSPICFACHMGNTLVRTHPELAVDRHRSADLSGR
jgi:hypothetical protein